MRKLNISMILIMSSLLVALSAHSGLQHRPIPPGLREGQKQINAPLDPPLEAAPGAPDPAKLKQEANELAQLSAGIPSDFSLVVRGQLPKDLADKLKRIEKLAKHLRNEISQ